MEVVRSEEVMGQPVDQHLELVRDALALALKPLDGLGISAACRASATSKRVACAFDSPNSAPPVDLHIRRSVRFECGTRERLLEGAKDRVRRGLAQPPLIASEMIVRLADPETLLCRGGVGPAGADGTDRQDVAVGPEMLVGLR